jgi:hypothetical protein
MLRKEGSVKCSILLPRHLYHPVLPFRCSNKLLFYLCKTCAIDLNRETDCSHESVAERALVVTWVLDEVRLAVGKGYRVIEVMEVYEYQATQFDPATGEGGLFAKYIF